MSTPDHSNQKTSGSAAGELAEIETILGQARDGSLAEDAAFDAISRVVHRRAAAAETYQKPWG